MDSSSMGRASSDKEGEVSHSLEDFDDGDDEGTESAQPDPRRKSNMSIAGSQVGTRTSSVGKMNNFAFKHGVADGTKHTDISKHRSRIEEQEENDDVISSMEISQRPGHSKKTSKTTDKSHTLKKQPTTTALERQASAFKKQV